MYRFVLVCVLVVFFVSGCVRRPGPIDRFMDLTVQLDSYAKQIEEKQNAIRDGLNAYNQTVNPGRRLSLEFENGYAFSGTEEAVLAKQIEGEEDPSCESILSDIAEKNEEIRQLAESMTALCRQMPSPYRAVKGEDHRAVCLRYLQKEHGLSRGAADSLVASVTVMENLAEGFDVWCVFADGKFATYVGRGSACISPACLEKRSLDSSLKESIAKNADSTRRRGFSNTTLLGSASPSISLK